MFICFEGIAGSGKTTQVALLADYLKISKGKTVFVGAAYEGNSRKVVSRFINSSGIKSDKNAVMFLFQALHSAHYYTINQALKSHQIVIADRWRQSFFSYHLHQRTFGRNKKIIDDLDFLAYRKLEPDVYFLIDLPAELAYRRYLDREKMINDHALELGNLKSFNSISKYYRRLAHNQNWYIIDGTQNKKAVFNNIKTTIDKIL